MYILLWVCDGFTLESRKRACENENIIITTSTTTTTITSIACACVSVCVPGSLRAQCLCSGAWESVCAAAPGRRPPVPAEDAGSSRTPTSPGNQPSSTGPPSRERERHYFTIERHCVTIKRDRERKTERERARDLGSGLYVHGLCVRGVACMCVGVVSV